ncbi:MAG TPA: filamentous hemagglutinin N-terminal domain-containing protein, partial [Lysobacter sp.]
MVVNWNNFDIAQGQTVNFAQPNASSAVLNRVVGPVKATDIQGTLNANGRVYVVNPAGVMFGQNAVVNADSVVASTLDIGAQQFMAGGRAAGNQKLLDLTAGSTKGSVVNQGRINARQVALLGGQVLNRGQINATGDVTLGSAQTATLSLDNSGFSVALGAPELNALVDNGGMIVAKGGNVRLTAAATGDALRNAVRNTGTIEARRATTGAGGSIELRSDADGQIAIGGKLTADDRINIEARPGTATSKGRTIVVEPLAQLQASDIALNAVGSTLTTNGSYTANTVTLAGDNVVVNAPVVSARDVNVYGANSVTQKANITGTGRVSINGNTIDQAAGVTTRGGAIELLSNTTTGSVKAATLDGEQVRIAGKTVALNEDVKGKYGIDVAAGRGGSITAAKSLTSDAGSVNLDAVGAKVVTRGAVNGQQVRMNADAVEIYAPVTGKGDVVLSGNVTGVWQAANVTSTQGNVMEVGGALYHAPGVTTTAARTAEFRAPAQGVPLAFNLGDIKASQVVVDNAAGGVNLNGAVSADAGVQVNVGKGSLTTAKTIDAKYGSVNLAATTVTTNGAITAGGDVNVSGTTIKSGVITAGNQIALNGSDVTLGGKLTARRVFVPANAKNTAGYIIATETQPAPQPQPQPQPTQPIYPAPEQTIPQPTQPIVPAPEQQVPQPPQHGERLMELSQAQAEGIRQYSVVYVNGRPMAVVYQ